MPSNHLEWTEFARALSLEMACFTVLGEARVMLWPLWLDTEFFDDLSLL